MQNLSISISENYKEFQQFLKSSNFSRAIIVGLAVTLPIVVGLQLGYFEIGLALSFGAFWSSPSDISGSFLHKKIGILISAAMVMIVAFIGGYLHYEKWLSLPFLGLLSFCIAYISIYGFRASLISFSGLLALVLSFAHNTENIEIYQYALLVGLGGLWYLLLAKIWYRINPKAETEELLSETFILTAEFLETRGKLIKPHVDYQKLQSKLQKQQSKLTENHATLREILIHSRKSSGWSNYQDRRLLVFVQLVEMLETAIANPVNYDKLDELLIEHPEFVANFQNLIFEMAKQLKAIAESGNNPKKLPKNNVLTACFEKVEQEVALFRTKNEKNNYEYFLMLQNLLEYQEKQFKKLLRIISLLGNTEIAPENFISKDVSRRFLVAQDYDPMLLIRNLSFRSNIFRHSLRLSATLMIGYTLGNLFPFQNPYWILLTIIVIMRPSYGLTKSRTKDRIIGTLIGGAVAVGIVYLIQNPYVYGVLGVLSLVFSFSMVQRNYKASATFVTLSVIFIYAIVQEDVLTVIKFRIVDTVVGAALSYVAALWLWPSWESVDIKESIYTSLKANKAFFCEIVRFYQNKGDVPTSLNLARKEAFLETSNLSSAFQRMAQEPKSKQKDMEEIYELVVLNHKFLASLSSLSAYIQNHKTTDASEQFTAVTDKIDLMIEQILFCLLNKPFEDKVNTAVIEMLFKSKFAQFNFKELRKIPIDDTQQIRNLQEAHLVWEQLQWLFSISEKMLKLAATLKRKEKV